MPQTPEAAECCAYEAAVVHCDGPATLYGDCVNVVTDAAKDGRTLDKAVYAGTIKRARLKAVSYTHLTLPTIC
eukprot:10627444-Alexandrium_andersonii.AAC.1